MIINPKNEQTRSAAILNCWDNNTIWQKITYQAPSMDGSVVPLTDVGKFILCVRRYSMSDPTPSCPSCRKETIDWHRNIRGDMRFSNMVGGFKAFIDKRLFSKYSSFIITADDAVVAGKGGREEQEDLPL